MKEKLDALLNEALGELSRAATEEGLQELRVRYLGKKGEFTSVMKGLGSLSAEERPVIGQLVNTVKARLEDAFDSRSAEVREAVKAQRLSSERIDVTLPGRRRPVGSRHPITLVTEEICAIFAALGFAVAEG
ncbi:MAG TPA: hypothetical protein VNT26_12275, partial [Candidatus Sulfotelmatobacter sp.]|nr:hypothetical protein [Candidatus Sulfotelmatobacter sp.]